MTILIDLTQEQIDAVQAIIDLAASDAPPTPEDYVTARMQDVLADYVAQNVRATNEVLFRKIQVAPDEVKAQVETAVKDIADPKAVQLADQVVAIKG